MARNNENKSWYILLVSSYGKNITGSFGKDFEIDSGLRHFPISLHRAGLYYSNSPNYRRNYGYYRISRIYSSSTSSYLDFRSSDIFPYGSGPKGQGYSVRCVAKCGDATDSICPKGWEMARFSGNKSYQNLISIAYRVREVENIPGGVGVHRALRIRPLSFVSNGANTASSQVGGRESYSYSWEARISTLDYAKCLDFNSTALRTQRTYTKGNGISVRCVAKCGNATDSICPKGWEIARNEGDGSYWQIYKVYSMLMSGWANSSYQPSKGTRYLDSPFVRPPFQFALAGNSDGRYLSGRTSNGNYITPRTTGIFYSWNFLIRHNDASNPTSQATKGYGYSVCWGAKIHTDLDLERFAGRDGAGLDS